MENRRYALFRSTTVAILSYPEGADGFCLSVSPDKQKVLPLCALCASNESRKRDEWAVKR